MIKAVEHCGDCDAYSFANDANAFVTENIGSGCMLTRDKHTLVSMLVDRHSCSTQS